MGDQGWFTIEKDDDGHRYVVPIAKKEEFLAWIEDIYDYWDFDSTRPETEEEPQLPEGIERVEGVRFREWEHQ